MIVAEVAGREGELRAGRGEIARGAGESKAADKSGEFPAGAANGVLAVAGEAGFSRSGVNRRCDVRPSLLPSVGGVLRHVAETDEFLKPVDKHAVGFAGRFLERAAVAKHLRADLGKIERAGDDRRTGGHQAARRGRTADRRPNPTGSGRRTAAKQ